MEKRERERKEEKPKKPEDFFRFFPHSGHNRLMRVIPLGPYIVYSFEDDGKVKFVLRESFIKRGKFPEEIA